ncbi:SGNH/GDSL hydrolase family protein [Eubacterium xylanophilum]|uniref:SGNH/GDSL hydrolase family protein n=1 Tax=Eubacterium xylanophilum TaxID=39497 RepID=UPI00047C2A45|nr:SGNH/GDSL hydrolase family protein [Eubacterium xylanophilum]
MLYLDVNQYSDEVMNPLRKIFKNKAMDEIKIGVLGTSISNGENVPKGVDYFSVLDREWTERLGTESKPLFINYSRSGTFSSNGIFSAAEICKNPPDIIFVDYSVNDTGAYYLHDTYEGIVHRFLEAGCMVCNLIFTNNQGHATRGSVLAISKHYNVPCIDLGQVVLDNIENGEFVWDDYALDYVHPNPEGHKFLADNLLKFFEFCLMEPDDSLTYKIPENPAFTGMFKNMTVVENMEYNNGYSYTGEFDAILAEITQRTDLNKCLLDLYIDGTYRTTLSLYNDFSWDNRVSEYIECEEFGVHKIEVKPSKGAIIKDKELKILNLKFGLGIFEDEE